MYLKKPSIKNDLNCKKLKPRVFTFSLRSTPLEQFDIIHQYVQISTHVLCQYLLPRTTSFHNCFDIFKGLKVIQFRRVPLVSSSGQNYQRNYI